MALRILMGVATYMNPGVMDEVMVNRGLACAECIGAVALLDAEHIGKKVWLQAPGRAVEGPFLVADCGAAHDRPRLLARGFVVDVDWETAQRWQMRGPLPDVRVLLDPPKPPPRCYIDMPCQGKW